MSEFRKHQTWSGKFANAFTGIAQGIQGQNSFYVHIPCAIAVVVAALFLGLDTVRLSVLLLCVGIVFAAELFNSSLEHFAVAITTDENSNIRDALNIASGAVLVVSICAAIIGMLILIPGLLNLVSSG